MNFKLTRYSLVLNIIASVLFGCNDSERDEDVETLTVREMALAYHVVNDAWREVHRVAMRDTLLGSPDSQTIKDYFLNSCIDDVSISDTVAVFPLSLVVNYGYKDYRADTSLRCDDGFERSGRINATFSGKYLNKGSEVEITFDEYYKDDFKIEGTSRIKNLGLNSNGYMRFTWEIDECRITSINTDFTWEGTHTMTWVAGRSTTDQGVVDDDVFNIDGFSQGRNSRGNTFYNEITSVYRSDFSCQWFTSGRSDLDIPNLEARTVNFGEASKCDNIVVERRNNTYFDVEIPY